MVAEGVVSGWLDTFCLVNLRSCAVAQLQDWKVQDNITPQPPPCIHDSMVQTQAQSPPTKRGPGRPSRAAQPPLKKVRASETPAQSSPSVQSPSAQSPAPANGTPKLPTKISDYRPLPTLPSPQSLSLPTSTHQSLADSGVLQASLDRSRLRWVHDGVFDRYWTKPETGKHARPPPPGNPEAKWMKQRGPCRLRVEPHIFECEVYVEEKPRPVVQKVQPQGQYGQSAYGGYGGQYRPGQPYGQQRPLPPVQHQTPVRQSPAPPLQQQRSQQSTPTPQPEKKTGADPVISMLATRASSDPELKALMKEVATGSATADQLKVFQRHIDDLTRIINEKKKKEEEEAAAADAKKAQEQQQESIRYDGAAEQRPHQPLQNQQPYQSQSHPQPQSQHQTWVPPPQPQQPISPQPPPPPTAPPVIIQFTTPGATEDRFLFPAHTIVESLSPQHLLCSTLITRKGSLATNTSFAPLDKEKEYFQSVTFMLEVAYGRENLIELVKKYVKPQEEVRKHMDDVMARCTRAPETHLALRLPVKGTEGAETEEERAEAEEEGRKRMGVLPGFGGAGGVGGGAHVKFVRKPGPKKGEGGRPVGVKNGEGKRGSLPSATAGAAGASGAAAAGGAVAPSPSGQSSGLAAQTTPVVVVEKKADAATGGSAEASKGTGEADAGAKKKVEETKPEGEAAADASAGAENKEAGAEEDAGRPKRTTRKSVRISEG